MIFACDNHRIIMAESHVEEVSLIVIIEGSVQGQVLHFKRRILGCSSAEGRSSTANSGTKAAVLQGIE